MIPFHIYEALQLLEGNPLIWGLSPLSPWQCFQVPAPSLSPLWSSTVGISLGIPRFWLFPIPFKLWCELVWHDVVICCAIFRSLFNSYNRANRAREGMHAHQCPSARLKWLAYDQKWGIPCPFRFKNLQGAGLYGHTCHILDQGKLRGRASTPHAGCLALAPGRCHRTNPRGGSCLRLPAGEFVIIATYSNYKLMEE